MTIKKLTVDSVAEALQVLISMQNEGATLDYLRAELAKHLASQPLQDPRVVVEFDWSEVNGSVDQAIKLALSYPEVKELAAGSDYTEQYFDISVSANSITLTFRPDPS